MDIKTFFNLCGGNWFTQRTYYNPSQDKTESTKADLTITIIPQDDSRLVNLCQENRIDPQLSIGGMVYSWDNSIDRLLPKQQGSSLLVIIPDSQNSPEGKILTSNPQVSPSKNSGRYILGNDEALTFTIETDTISISERLWFVSENLRLRSTLIKDNSNRTQTFFYSEIRKMPIKK